MYSKFDSDHRPGVSAKSVNPIEISTSLRQLAEPNLFQTFKNLRRNIGYLSVTVSHGKWTSMDNHDLYVGFYDYAPETNKPVRYRFFVAETGQVVFQTSIPNQKYLRSAWEHLGDASLVTGPNLPPRLAFYAIYDKKLSVLGPEGEELPSLPF